MTDPSTNGTERPSNCENPEADCYREPVREVRWAEDVTSETHWMEVWMCDPCAQILRRGTVISPNELDIGVLLNTDADQ